jgi:hypothetical protein
VEAGWDDEDDDDDDDDVSDASDSEEEEEEEEADREFFKKAMSGSTRKSRGRAADDEDFIKSLGRVSPNAGLGFRV